MTVEDLPLGRVEAELPEYHLAGLLFLDIFIIRSGELLVSRLVCNEKPLESGHLFLAEQG